MQKPLLVILISIALAGTASSQDSLEVLSENEFLGLVLDNHPVARQAALLSEYAAQEIRAARGAFDPKWETSFDEKTFVNTRYWTKWSHELKLPLTIGPELRAGLDKANGQFISEELANLESGLAYGGISVPVLQGLFTDQRRTDLRQARLLPELAEAERAKAINKLILEAAKDYWGWSNFYRQYVLASEGVELAEFRFNAVRQQVLNGDIAPIDSVEALILLDTRKNDLRMAEVEWKNAGLSLSNYLWSEELAPLELNSATIPTREVVVEALDGTLLPELLERAQLRHPELIKLQVKSQQLVFERKLNVEMLKPYLAVNYNLLTYPTNVELADHIFFENNYKMGFTASMPLFLRKERAKLSQTNLKITENRLQTDNFNRQLQNDIVSHYNYLLASYEIINAQRDIVVNNELLREGELSKFNNGESSLFLVNTRESKLLEARSKLIKAETDYRKWMAALYYAAGLTLSIQ